MNLGNLIRGVTNILSSLTRVTGTSSGGGFRGFNNISYQIRNFTRMGSRFKYYFNGLGINLKNKSQNSAIGNNMIKQDANMIGFTNLIKAGVAMGLAAAASDGISQNEMNEIDRFVSELSNVDQSALPEDFFMTIQTLKQNPPNFDIAVNYVSLIKTEEFDCIDEVVKNVIDVDGSVSEAEKEFLSQWESYKLKF